MNDRLDLAIAAYHDGTLEAAGADLLAAAVRGADGEAVRSRLAMAGLLAQAFTADDAVVRSVRARLDGERSASAVVKAVRSSLATHRGRRPLHSAWRPRVAMAALLLLVVGAGWWFGLRAHPRVLECHLAPSGAALLVRGSEELPLDVEGGLSAGERVRATGTATLTWNDGSRLVLDAGTQVRLVRPASGPGLYLDQGVLLAEIAPQRPGLPFAIATPQGRVEVLGTRFRLSTTVARTAVALDEGVVRFTRISDGQALTLRPGQHAVIAPGEEFVARATAPVTPPPAAPPAPSPEPAWEPLFNDSGLDGWVQQHGRWSNQHGRVRGDDPHQGKARLLGTHPFADLELTCRLRITGVDFAEVQVGDYNWFAEVPANGDQWVQVQIHQHGSDLTITADGRALALHAGDGQPMRAGPLAFYVMPGGTLEIFDARFRIPPASPATR